MWIRSLEDASNADGSGQSKTSAKRNRENLSGAGDAMARSDSKRLRPDEDTPAEMDDSHVEEEVGLQTPGAIPDTAAVDPQFIRNHCRTVVGVRLWSRSDCSL